MESASSAAAILASCPRFLLENYGKQLRSTHVTKETYPGSLGLDGMCSAAALSVGPLPRADDYEMHV